MAHRPHVHLPAPWEDEVMPLSPEQIHRYRKVLRLSEGDAVDYTDGRGTVGSGRLAAAGIERGGEHTSTEPRPWLIAAVAPPRSRDRLRFLVEKLSELGVSRVRWLRAAHGEGRPPKADRAATWAVSALEQSRGAWLTEVDEDWCEWRDLDGPVVVADFGGVPAASSFEVSTLAVGPAGGWADDEIPPGVVRISLGVRVLRVETAALVGAAHLLAR